MAVYVKQSVPRHTADQAPETLESLRGACVRMVPHWVVPAVPVVPVPPSLIHGVTVPAATARVLDGMSDYGD
ncbi:MULTISPECIES: hypothetical protein [Streptomyces]|uniref:Uncharacterized protein n=2 Tax=Streptomyces TaxID=1883 RepID=A0A0W7WXQ5_9ACTN|nr:MULTISPECIES: hypothetical protein [Streptomyces]KUF15372.1 hypothetical protein AT728_29910 [Streptomyces silvensis]MVO89111.1 hypothetical protein [Streptomyces typhae]